MWSVVIFNRSSYNTLFRPQTFCIDPSLRNSIHILFIVAAHPEEPEQRRAWLYMASGFGCSRLPELRSLLKVKMLVSGGGELFLFWNTINFHKDPHHYSHTYILKNRLMLLGIPSPFWKRLWKWPAMRPASNDHLLHFTDIHLYYKNTISHPKITRTWEWALQLHRHQGTQEE